MKKEMKKFELNLESIEENYYFKKIFNFYYEHFFLK